MNGFWQDSRSALLPAPSLAKHLRRKAAQDIYMKRRRGRRLERKREVQA